MSPVPSLRANLILFITLLTFLTPSISLPILNLRLPNSMDPDQEIEFDFSPHLILYKSGRVERLVNVSFIPPSTDPDNYIKSKDIVIDSATGLRVRVFMPDIPGSNSSSSKLPVVVYFHGGSFVVESAFSSTYNSYIKSLTERANIMAVSVEYRLAPEHPLPVAYDDSFRALQWVASHANGHGDPWLVRYGDFQRLFLAGDSAGGNIAHNIVVRTKTSRLRHGVSIKGLALLNPYFWGKEPIGDETTDVGFREKREEEWEFVTGWQVGLDSPWVDPVEVGVNELKELACERVRVSVADYDWSKYRSRRYYDALKENGWNGMAELWETSGEAHDYFLFKPDSDKAKAEMESLVAFINRD